MLRRRARREARFHEIEEAAVDAMLGAVLTRIRAAGYLDDAAFAVGRARGLSGRGRSLRRVRADLVARGVGRADAEAAIERLRQERPEPDLAAAVSLARRKRLGPWREPPEDRAATRARDMAVLARAGFDSAVVREVVAAASPEELEERLAELLAEAPG